MLGFGHAMQEFSRISDDECSCQSTAPCIGSEMQENQHTERRMLKGECDNILDPLHGQRKRVAWEAFTDDNLYAAKVVSGMPVILSKKLLTKVWEPQRLKVSILRDTCGSCIST